MKEIRICAVVTGKTKEEFLSNLEKIQEVSELVELRVDYIEGFSEEDVELVKRKCCGAGCKPAPAEIKKKCSGAKIKYIFTCRKREEGGFFTGEEKERVGILKKALEIGFDYVDVELAAVNFQFSIFNFQSNHNDSNKKSKIILSYHNFNNTLTISELEAIKKEMKKNSPDIMKFATLSKGEDDNKTIFKFLLDKKDDEEMIVVGMGEKGRVTRVVAPFLGSYLTYASTENSRSAEGQIELEELKKLYNELRLEGLKL